MSSPKPRHLPVALVVLAAGLASGACRKSPPGDQHLTAATSAATIKRLPPPLSDADIAHAIERHFQGEGLMRSGQLQVGVSRGVAILTGSVNDLRVKERALRVAETIKGVRSVVDQVAVKPVARTDEQLKADVALALRRDNSTRPYPIGVAVKDGKVTLTGTADSWQQKQLFGAVAKTVPGLVELVNSVAVHYAVERSAPEILADVKYRIANDVWLDGDVVGVTVDGRTVRLRGVVGSVAQKNRAALDAWVAGVDIVDDDGVNVDWLATRDQRRITDFPIKTDAEIADAVRDAFRFDPRLRRLVPQVTVKDGVATLTGNVDSAMARSAAEADAKDTLGVWAVHDQVLVEPAKAPDDAEVERAVKRALTEDLLLSDGKAIEVSSAKGTVSVKGPVASGFERFHAIADVSAVPGVSAVNDSLTTNRSPDQIQKDVEDALFWDPMVERERVTVFVAPDGVATLTGTLDAWSEIREAGDDALWAGATRVINLLELKKHPEVRAR